MSLDLFEQESNQQLSRLTPVMQPEVGTWDGFARGTAMHTMRNLAKVGRSIDLLGSVGPIMQDAFTGGTTAQDRYFKEHEEVWGSAVDYWTPKPLEVGAAGEIAGTLAAMLPMILASPGLAIGATQIGTAEDLVLKGVDSTRAQAVGAVQGAGLGLGIYMPIFGQTFMQRVLAGGVGFNVAQGVAMRGASQAILAGTPGAEDFKAFDMQALTLDAVLGAAFGAIVHLSPSQRAEGARMWQKMEGWAKSLKPSDVDALTALRQAQHMNVDSLPGKPVDPVDVDNHVQRLRTSLEQVVRDQPVEVSDMPAGKFTPDEARNVEAMQNARILQEAAEEVRVAEGMPKPPRIDIPLNDGALTPEQRAVESTVRQRVLDDVDGHIEAYKKLPESENGKIINTDVARELFQEYQANRSINSAAVHESASTLMKEYYSRILAQPDPNGLNMVSFTAGGTGAGKTTARGHVPVVNEIVEASQVIYDTNMSGTRSAIDKIDLALAHGKQVNIVFVGTDPVDAFRRMLKRATDMETDKGSGRTVPLDEHAKTHVGSARTMEELQEHYQGNDRVQFVFLNNRAKAKGQVEIVEPANSREFLRSMETENLNEQLKGVLDAEYEAGRISENVYRGTAGALARGEGQADRAGGTAEPAGGGRPGGEAGARLPREEVKFKDKPKPGEPLLVYRLGSEGGLENRNAGNADALGLFLRRLDDIDAPQPAGRTGDGGQMLTAYEVVSEKGYGLYSTFDQGTPKRVTDMPGRRAGFDGRGIEYSFPKDTGWEARPIASVSIDEVRAALKQISEFDNFDDAGGALTAKAVRRAFASKLPTSEAPATQQGAADSPPPRGQSRAEGAGAEDTLPAFRLDPEATFAPGSPAQALPTVEILNRATALVGPQRFQELVEQAIAAETAFRAEASPGRTMDVMDTAMEIEHVGRQIVAWADDVAAAKKAATAPVPMGDGQLKGPEGAKSRALTERGTELDVRFRLVEAPELVTSHDDALKPRADYPQEVQPRERGRAASEAQIAGMQNNIRPELLGQNPKASDGAPIVGSDGVVESGNARTIALRRAYRGGQAANYKAWLAANAESFGLKAADVERMQEPVLVRERLTEVDRASFAREANESSVAAMGAAETARSDVARMPTLDRLVTAEDGSINVRASMDFIRDFMDSVPPSERPLLMTADGSLSQAGLTRIRNAVFQRAYGDADLVSLMAESTDANIKNVLTAMLRAAPDVAKLDEMVEAGARYPTNFPKDLAKAVRLYSQLRADGMPVKTFLSQGQMFDSGVSPAVKGLLEVLDANSRAPNRMVAAISEQLDLAHGQGNPKQAGLFGEEKGAEPADPLKLAAEKVALEQPELKMRMGTDSNGNPIHKTVKEFLDDATTAADNARQDVTLFEAAARCLIGAGA